jgi:hypothetical protein
MTEVCIYKKGDGIFSHMHEVVVIFKDVMPGDSDFWIYLLLEYD